MPSKTPAKDKPKATEEKVEEKGKKDPLAKFVGKKTKDSRKITGFNRKVIKKINQPDTNMVELLFEDGSKTIVPEETIKEML